MSSEEPSHKVESYPDYYNDTIDVGFSNWWYGIPMVMYSSFDEYDFSGETVIPFCTSGGRCLESGKHFR